MHPNFEIDLLAVQKIDLALRLSEERFQLASRATHDALYDMDLVSGKIFWGEAYGTIFGYVSSEQQHQLHNWLLLIHPDDRTGLSQHFNDAVSSKEYFWTHQYRYRCADGSYKNVNHQAYFIYNSDNEPVRMIGAMKEMELQQDHTAIPPLEAVYFNQLFEASPFGVVLLNAQNLVQKVNSTFESMFHFRANELIGQDLGQFIVPASPAEDKNLIPEKNLTRQFIQLETKRKTKEGKELPVKLIVYPILSNNGVEGIFAFYCETGRKKNFSEDAHQSDIRYRTLVDSMQEGLINVDNNDAIQYVNKRFCEIVGYQEDELIGKISHQLFIDPRQHNFIKAKNLQRQQGLTDEYEMTLRRKDGHKIWVSVKASPMRNENGEVIGSNGYISDITHRKVAEEQLRASEERYRVLFEKNPQPMFVIDMATLQFVQVNTAAIRHYGYTEEQFLSMKVEDLRTSEELSTLNENVQQLRLEGEYHVLTQHKKQNGEIIEVEVSASELTLSDSYVYLAIITDVTRQRRSQQERDRLAKIIENTRDMVGFSDLNGQHIYINSAGQQLLGFTQEELLNAENSRHIWQNAIMHQKGIQHATEYNYWRGETMLPTKDGKKIPVSQVIVAHKNDKNQAVYFSTIARDITEQKQFEDELKHKNEELQRINADLDRFVYSASHDLRAPLTSLQGLINIAETETEDEVVKEYLGMMKNCVSRLDSFIGDIIQYSRSQRIAVKPEEIDTDVLMQEVIQDLQYMGGADRISISFDIEKCPKFISDRRSISILLNNLVSNAIKYHNLQQEKPFVKVSFEKKEDDVEIVVEDNGSGIEDRYLNNIFDMFFRATEQSSGSGLGLFIVKEIIEKLNGHIDVQSEIGKGTKFIVEIPPLDKQTTLTVETADRKLAPNLEQA